MTRQVFTDAQKAGNFAPQLGNVIGTDALGSSVRAGQIFDPYAAQTLPNGTLVRTPFPNNTIPPSLINPVSRALIEKVPQPNVSGSPNFVRNVGASRNIDTYLSKFDWVKSVKDTISDASSGRTRSQITAPAFGFPADGVRDGGTGGVTEFASAQRRRPGHTFSARAISTSFVGLLASHRQRREPAAG